MPKCLARLTKWNKTSCRLAPCMTACRVVVCKNVPKDAEGTLCEECLARPLDGKYQDRMIHGLLTEPIPESSRIYGGPWYWSQIQKHGEPSNQEWLSAAMESQRIAEEFCGPGAWKVQRLSEKEIEMRKRMAVSKKQNTRLTKIPLTKEKVAGTVLAAFSPIKVLYEEAPEEPVKMETDTLIIRKEKFGNGPNDPDLEVWITANGLVFDCDTTGEPGELIARYINKEFIDL